MSKNPKNKIVVLVIEDEALILDLMEEVLADLDVPRKIRRGGFRNVHRHSAFNIYLEHRQAFYGATGPWERMNLLLNRRERKRILKVPESGAG